MDPSGSLSTRDLGPFHRTGTPTPMYHQRGSSSAYDLEYLIRMWCRDAGLLRWRRRRNAHGNLEEPPGTWLEVTRA